ncbi:prepro-urotensin II-beta-like [Megalops cyprinoides]|uniref:prepro-urotensin II-beta-like n=1 Tax=Megalops cyprinoides TaxID=118141 RepID=UPI001864B4C1|nr:prepro-urotensin II-beta-like [Megalops cyprinoides]
MMCKLLLSWAVLLIASGPLKAHPITDSSDLSFPGPVLAEEGEVTSPGELSLSDPSSQSGTGLEYTSLLAEELNRDGIRSASFTPREAVKGVLLEKQNQLLPLRRFLGYRKQFGKRGNPTDCFWKYCV